MLYQQLMRIEIRELNHDIAEYHKRIQWLQQALDYMEKEEIASIEVEDYIEKKMEHLIEHHLKDKDFIKKVRHLHLYSKNE